MLADRKDFGAEEGFVHELREFSRQVRSGLRDLVGRFDRVLARPVVHVRSIIERLCRPGHGRRLDFEINHAVEIRRASHVEPDERGAWWADPAPCHGPRLGPFERRSLALAAELA